MVTSTREAIKRCWIPLLAVLSFQLVVGITDPAETRALLALKASLIDDDGGLASWTSATDPCDSWSGIDCVVEDYPSSLAGSNFSHVTELRLLSLNLGGQLADDVGDLQALKYLNFMWNQLTGSIPASVGKLSNLYLMLLNGNNFTGVLPPEIGNLQNLNRIQIDQNRISGPVPASFTNLTMIQHLHMNNNSLNGSIPSGLGNLPGLVHVLLDNNDFTGSLPPDLANAPSLLIIQLDNNQFDSNATIPAEYGQIPTLLKLSLRNCNLRGEIPSLDGSTSLAILDLSQNNLNGSIPALPSNITAIDLSFNQLSGNVSDTLGNLAYLQHLALRNNLLSGVIPANLGTGPAFENNNTIVLDFQNNSLSLASDSNLPLLQSQGRIQLWLFGNPEACNGQPNPLCIATTVDSFLSEGIPQTPSPGVQCSPCNSPYVVVPTNDPERCRCAAPVTVRYRLKSPSFTFFDLYEVQFHVYISEGLNLTLDQVYIQDYTFQPGPRIAITLLLFPTGLNFNNSELERLEDDFTNWEISDSELFGPYELLQFIPPGSLLGGGSSGLSGGAIAGIIIACILLTAGLASVLFFFYMRRKGWDTKFAARRGMVGSRRTIKVAGVRTFSFEELVKATDNFSDQNVLGQGGYGKVYFGVLEDGQKVAVKRAEEGSLQGANEFETEIQLLSRVHHRNLVSLVGYCNDEGEHSQGEQMLVYEYMPNGTLREHLDKGSKFALDCITRLRIALGSARGVHYLHTQADPPIFHRDIKASNILLDGKYNAKVADFGLSKLAPTDVDFEGANAGHVSTVVKGTPGYLDPEYFLTHKLTDKSDVYSFGVVLLELITGMHPISQGKNIVREVNTAYITGGLVHVVDPRMGTYPAETLEPFTRLALACCKSDTDARPSMAEVLHELEEIWKETPWSDVASHSFIGDREDSEDFSVVMSAPKGFSYEMNMYDGSYVGSNSGLVSGTNINVLPR